MPYSRFLSSGFYEFYVTCKGMALFLVAGNGQGVFFFFFFFFFMLFLFFVVGW